MAEPLPTLFLSHGSPMTAIEPGATHDFLVRLGQELPRPDAILCISAHWETARPAVTASPNPPLIYDFYGFPRALYDVRYPVPGSPALAQRTAALLGAAGIPCDLDPARGLDHGTWDPLVLVFPKADVPVVQLSIQPDAPPTHHLDVGRALAPLRDDNVLIVGSGNTSHNLGIRFDPSRPPPPWVVAFGDWVDARVAAGDAEGLASYRAQAPYARENHPTEDHYLPLLPAIAAAGPGAKGRKIHAGYDAHLDMASYAFG